MPATAVALLRRRSRLGMFEAINLCLQSAKVYSPLAVSSGAPSADLAPPPQLFDLPSQFVYLFFQAATPQLFDLPSQFVYLPPVLFFHEANARCSNARWHRRCCRRFKARRLWNLWRLRRLHHHSRACPHNALLFRRIVQIRLQIESSFLLGLLFLDLEWIGCGPRVLSSSRYLPTDLHPLFAARYVEAVLGNLLGDVQVWRRPADGGELVAKILIQSFAPLGQLYRGGTIRPKPRNAIVDVFHLIRLNKRVVEVP